MQLNILASLYTISCLGTKIYALQLRKIIHPFVSSDETYKFTRNTSKLMHTRLLFDHKSSMRLLYGILSPKRTKIKLRWYREELPRFACNDHRREASVTIMLDEPGWRSLKQRRADQRLIMLYKIVNNLVEVDLSTELIPCNYETLKKQSGQILQNSLRKENLSSIQLFNQNYKEVEQFASHTSHSPKS